MNATILFLTLLAQSSTETWVNTPRPLQAPNLNQLVDLNNAAVYKSGAAQLIRQTTGVDPGKLTFVIHAARFSDAGEVVKQNWYVYHSGTWTDAQFSSAKRIYGKRQIWLLYIQINARPGANATYTIETSKKSAAYFDHLQQALSLYGITLSAGEPANLWNAKAIDIPYTPSDVTITPPSGGAVTFDNEGLSFVDFSVAAPAKQAAAFGVVDLYVRPVDIKSTLGFGNWPHLVEGVQIGNRPLKSILLGVGWGPFYGGVIAGGGAYKFSFGVNISAGAAVSALKK